MLKFLDYDIVFQEIPDEVTLAINVSNCPFRCKGCHSPQLQQDIGEALDEEFLSWLLQKYGLSITCVCFMGGDIHPEELYRLSDFVRKNSNGNLKTAWYSGCNHLRSESIDHFNFVKIGPFIQEKGGLDKPGSNQRLLRITDHSITDITHLICRV